MEGIGLFTILAVPPQLFYHLFISFSIRKKISPGLS
jgi:hypothetical protein